MNSTYKLEERYEAIADKLEELGYQGIDATPAIALYEYTWMMREAGNGTWEAVLYTGPVYDGWPPDPDRPVFHFTQLYEDDLDYVLERDGEDIAETCGVTLEELKALPFPIKADCANAYVGFITGVTSCRWPDYTLEEVEEGKPSLYL